MQSPSLSNPQREVSPQRQAWAQTSLSERLAWLRRFRCLVAANQPLLCELMEQEVRKPRHEALLTDVTPLLAACKWLEKHAPRVLRERAIGDAPFWMRGLRTSERRVPLGRVGIIATWNYPVQLLGIQLAHALIAGNSVVVKPSERSPKTQQRLLEIAVEAGLPEGVLTWTGPTREAGATMIATRKFDHVIFTGSTEVGQRIAQTLARSLTGATLELSGRDSVFVMSDADVKLAAKAVWAGLCMNAGQTCMGPRRVLVHEAVYDKFTQALAKHASKSRSVELIDETSASRCKDLVARAVSAGARDASTLLGSAGEDRGSLSASASPARLFRPTAMVHCPPTAELVEGRHFGPLTAVVKCANLEEMLWVHRRCDQHLTCAVFTRNHAGAARLADALGVTNLMINDLVMPTGHPGVSIGGRGPSGVGVSRGEEGLLALTRPVYVSVSSGMVRSMLRPLPAWQAELLAAMLRRFYGAGNAERARREAARLRLAGEAPAAPAEAVVEATPAPVLETGPALAQDLAVGDDAWDTPKQIVHSKQSLNPTLFRPVMPGIQVTAGVPNSGAAPGEPPMAERRRTQRPI